MNPQTPPPPKDSKNVKGQNAPLSEKDFIQNGWNFLSLPFWIWFALIAALAGVIWGTAGWYQGIIKNEKRHDPFLEVTNREFSVFLWQFPSFLRVNVPKKTGYLPGFLSTSENLNPATANEFVSAPPDLLFLYHTWSRLLSPNFSSRPITPAEFDEFLKQLPEWEPNNWQGAPQGYVQLIDSKSYSKVENLQTLPEAELPVIVRQAFQGWKNYFKEGSKINDIHPTYGQMKAFLEKHPTYGRSYWRNISEVENQKVAGSDYLLVLLNATFIPDATIPNDQLANFLKVALYNDEQAGKSL